MVADKNIYNNRRAPTTICHLSKTICNHLTLVRYYHYLYVSITAVRYGLFVFMLSKLCFLRAKQSFLRKKLLFIPIPFSIEKQNNA